MGTKENTIGSNGCKTNVMQCTNIQSEATVTYTEHQRELRAEELVSIGLVRTILSVGMVVSVQSVRMIMSVGSVGSRSD